MSLSRLCVPTGLIAEDLLYSFSSFLSFSSPALVFRSASGALLQLFLIGFQGLHRAPQQA